MASDLGLPSRFLRTSSPFLSPAITHMSMPEANSPTLQVTTALANNLTVASWETLDQNDSDELSSDSLLSETE